MTLVLVPPVYFNAANYVASPGAPVDGAVIQAAINAAQTAGGGAVWLPGPSHTLHVPLSITVPGISLIGPGRGACTLQQAADFVGAAMISASGAGYVTLRDFLVMGNTTTYSSNPACDGIDLIGIGDARVENVYVQAMNGWGFASLATNSTGNRNIVFDNAHAHQCASGFHIMGQSGSGNVGLHYLSNCNSSSTQNGDAWLIEDIHDIMGTNLLGSCGAGTGHSFHVKGNCGAIYLNNVDFGPFPGPAAGNIIQINGGANGTPNNVTVRGGILEGGTVGVNIGAGLNITMLGLTIFNNITGLNISGGADRVFIEGCQFVDNGSVAGTNYEIVNSSSGQKIFVSGCNFDTPRGSHAGNVADAINDSSGTMTVANNFFSSGLVSNVFATGGVPNMVAGIYPFPGGDNITAPTLTGSPFTAPTKANTYCVYLTGGTVSDVAIGGVSTGKATGLFIVPAQQTITVTYSVTPTWTWFKL